MKTQPISKFRDRHLGQLLYLFYAYRKINIAAMLYQASDGLRKGFLAFWSREVHRIGIGLDLIEEFGGFPKLFRCKYKHVVNGHQPMSQMRLSIINVDCLLGSLIFDVLLKSSTPPRLGRQVMFMPIDNSGRS